MSARHSATVKSVAPMVAVPFVGPARRDRHCVCRAAANHNVWWTAWVRIVATMAVVGFAGSAPHSNHIVWLENVSHLTAIVLLVRRRRVLRNAEAAELKSGYAIVQQWVAGACGALGGLAPMRGLVLQERSARCPVVTAAFMTRPARMNAPGISGGVNVVLFPVAKHKLVENGGHRHDLVMRRVPGQSGVLAPVTALHGLR